MTTNGSTIRKRTTLAERREGCAWCEHPISQKHHILEFATNGENAYTTLLCSNCHELYHIAYRVYTSNSQRSYDLWSHFVNKVGQWDLRVRKILELVAEARDLNLQAEIERSTDHSLNDEDFPLPEWEIYDGDFEQST